MTNTVAFQACAGSDRGWSPSGLLAPTLIILPILLSLLALCLGRYMVSPGNALAILFGQLLPIEPNWEAVEQTVVLMALIIGAGLAVSGAAFQGLFGNPLVSPHILGVSSGAGFGAALTILIFRHMAFVPVGRCCLASSP